MSNELESRLYIFTSIDGHSAERVHLFISGGIFDTVWRKVPFDAVIDIFQFHDLRHAFATRMLRETQNIETTNRDLNPALLFCLTDS